MFQAIEIMAGSTEMNPDLARRVRCIEEVIRDMSSMVKTMQKDQEKMLNEDGELNVVAVKKELSKIKMWVMK